MISLGEIPEVTLLGGGGREDFQALSTGKEEPDQSGWGWAPSLGSGGFGAHSLTF